MSPLGHGVVAHRLLEDVRAHLSAYPPELQLAARDPRLRAHFLGGAMAADLLGRSGNIDLGVLAHRGVPAALAQALLRGAKTSEERSFAMGWITHLAADRTLHPFMVGRGLDHDARGASHVSFEVALDVVVASWAQDLQAATLVTGQQYAEDLLGRALTEVVGRPVTVKLAPLVGYKVASTAVHMDGGALAKRKLLGKPKLGPKAEDPDGVLAAVAKLAARGGTTDPATLKLKPSKEIQQLYAQAKARAWDLLAGALRGEWEPLNRDLETGGVPGAAHRPPGVAAVGYYYALAGAAEDRGREAEIMKQLTRRGHGNSLLCRGLPPAGGGLLRLALPPAPGPGPGPSDFVPICLGPYGTREQALKIRVALTEAARGAYRDATGKPSTAVTLATEDPRLAL
ncbi:MAG: zinc dependent phospholipase C family protein [Deltaproteobacteria bacterium]|nr:zinc dependent phospholipase C family protein [Deltaproteobacteria bacterium]